VSTAREYWFSAVIDMLVGATGFEPVTSAV